MRMRPLEGASPWFPLYYLLVVGGGLGLLTFQLPQAAGTPWILFGLWVILLLATDAAPVRLPGGGYITVSSTLDYAGILVLGPVPTALAEFVATLVLQLGLQRRPVYKAIFNASSFAGTVLLAGSVYSLLGGRPGALIHVPQIFLPLLAMGVTYYALNTTIVSCVLALTDRRQAWRIWQINYIWTIFHMVASLPFGVLFAAAYQSLGVWGVVLFLLPLLVARYAFKLYMDTKEDLEDFAGALANIIDEWDPYTSQHSRRVSGYATQLARELGLSEREVDVVRLGGLLHDIGKITVSQFALVTKAGRLTPEERIRMCEHPDLGADILERVRAFRRVAPIVRYHHERIDGKGYHRLPARETPMGSRIVLVADAFDAMTTDRVYRKGMSVEVALAELRRHAGAQFDEQVVDALGRLVARGKIGAVALPVLRIETAITGELAPTGTAV